MITISATEFHNHFAEYLDRVTQGETVNIAQDHREIAQMTPSKNWRNRMTIQPVTFLLNTVEHDCTSVSTNAN